MPKPHAPSRPKAPLARYANYFEVGHNAYEFLLDYGQYQPETSSVVLHTRVALGPTHAKMLATMLNGAVERYEREHGAIQGVAEVLESDRRGAEVTSRLRATGGCRASGLRAGAGREARTHRFDEVVTVPAQIRPNRLEVTDRFPMLGFTIRTDGAPQRAEVAVATDPALFQAQNKGGRTHSNFYSSRATGPLPVPRGEGVYMVPAEVLARFIGQERLYVALATAPERNGQAPRIDVMPGATAPYVSLRGLTGRSLRRMRVLPTRQYRAEISATRDRVALEWTGDSATTAAAPNGAANGSAKPSTAVQAPAPADYDDGFGPMVAAPASTPAPAAAPNGAANGNGVKSASAPVSAAAFEYGAATRPPVWRAQAARPAPAPMPSPSAAQRALALAAEIPLDPGNGGRSIGLDALEIGDVIVSTTSAAVSRGIRFATGSEVSHAMLFVGQGGQVIDATRARASGRCPRRLRMPRWPSRSGARRCRTRSGRSSPIARPSISAAPTTTGASCGRRVSRCTVVVCDLLPKAQANACRRFVGYVNLGRGSGREFFCSELVVAAYEAAGAPITDTPPNWTTPDDLAQLGMTAGALAYVGHLKAPPYEARTSLWDSLGLAMAASPRAAAGPRAGARHEPGAVCARAVEPAGAVPVSARAWVVGH